MAASPAREASAEKEGDDGGAPCTVTISPRVPYTEDEKVLLRLLQENITHHRITDATSWVEETLPLLISMVEKVLQIAAESYESKKKKNNNNTNNRNNNNNNNNDTHEKDDSNNNAKSSTTSCMTNSGLKGGAAATGATSYQIHLFHEENAYIMEQLRLQDGPFFTLPRLWEVLADPFKYNCDADGVLRGEKLQSAIRRCVLVSVPMLTEASSPDQC